MLRQDFLLLRSPRCCSIAAAAVLIAASPLSAQQPNRTETDQTAEALKPTVDRPADATAVTDPAEGRLQNLATGDNQSDPPPAVLPRVMGMTLENKGRQEPFVKDVFPTSPAWDAGVRKGDYLVRFGDVSDLPYDEFIQAISEVAEENYEGDKIPIVVQRSRRPADQPREGRNPDNQLAESRDGQIEMTIAAVGRTPEEMRELQERAQEKLEESRTAASQPSRAATTEELEELIQLQKAALAGELSEADRDRYYELDQKVYGGGFGGMYGLGYGGYGVGGGYGVAAGGGPQTTVSPDSGVQGATPGDVDSTYGAADGTFNGGEANGRPGDSPSSQAAGANPGMQAEYQRLQAARGGGGLSTSQLRRLQAMEQLSGSGMNQSAMSQQQQMMQRLRGQEFNRLQAAANGGATLNAMQQSRLQQYRSSFGGGAMQQGGQSTAAPGTARAAAGAPAAAGSASPTAGAAGAGGGTR